MGLGFIFLDIDGVINPINNFVIRTKLGLSTRNDAIEFPNCTMISLKKIIESTNSFIVLSSTWRFFWDTYGVSLNPVQENIRYQFQKFNMNICDITPIRPDRIRGLEIFEWLNTYVRLNHKIKSVDDIAYLIIDDDISDISEYHRENKILKIDSLYGLTPLHVDKAIKLLNTQQHLD